jgi:hypothetical protein
VRGIRIVLACLVGALGIVAVSTAAHAAAPTAPYNMVSVDDAGSVFGFAADYVDISFSHTAAMPNENQAFTGSEALSGDSPRSIDVAVSSADGATALVPGTYPVANANTPGDARLSIAVNNGFCSGAAGTLDVLEAPTDGSGNIVSFAADYTGVTCSGGTSATLSGVIRWNSGSGYNAVQTSPHSWDFGNQPLKVDSHPVTITFTNAGTDSVTYGTAALTGAAGAFVINADGCSGLTFAAGAPPCSIKVVANPKAAVTDTFLGSFATLTLPSQTAGLTDRVVKFGVEGNDFATYALAGAHQVNLHWRQLPAPISAVVDHYRINRGTAPHSLTPFRNVSPGCCPVDQLDGSVTPGKVYYYSIQPMFAGGAAGAATPVLAAEPWPKYGPGMYHNVGPTRVVSSHLVSAGHPYTLQMLGQHGVPSAGVAAVALNILGSNATSSTNVTVFPTGSPQPSAADLALARGATATNFALVKVGSGGRITIATSHGSAKVFVDLSGFISGNGLTASYGQGGALQEYTRGGVIMDTKAYHIGALKHGYYVDSPVNFDVPTTPHVKSLLLSVSAYGSTAPGSITAFRTSGTPSSTTVLAYGAGGIWSNTALVASGLWSDPSTGQQYPSVSFLNRGPKPVQLKVAILGFVDDNYYLSGQRYYATDPTRLLASTLGANVTRTVSPGKYGHSLTTALNLKVSASPSQSTSVTMWPLRVGVGSAVQPQLRTHGRTVSSTLEATGQLNTFAVENASGRDALTIWSFGRFDAWPVPNNWYVGAATTNAATTDSVTAGAATTSPRQAVISPSRAMIGRAQPLAAVRQS